MPDVCATIATADEAVQERLADVLEMRAADPQQRAMLDSYLDDLALPGGARVLDLGCGTGARREPSPSGPSRQPDRGALLGRVSGSVLRA
jgi:hypothetical protein